MMMREGAETEVRSEYLIEVRKATLIIFARSRRRHGYQAPVSREESTTIGRVYNTRNVPL